MQECPQCGEVLEAKAYVSQRHWWNYYHETNGLLATTERRILFIGVVPRGLIEPLEEDAPLLDVRSWPYDSVTVTPARLFLGTARGVAFASRAGREAFAVTDRDWSDLQRVTTLVRRRQAALREAAERERRTQEYVAWLARQPVYHVVRPGDALLTVAGQYGLTPDSLRALNGLPSDKIKIGQRLLVKPGS